MLKANDKNDAIRILNDDCKIHMQESKKLLKLDKSQNSQICIEFNDICYSVQTEKKVLHNVTGHFETKKVTIIIGASGAGKSTLLKIISGQRLNNVKGTITVNGVKSNRGMFRKQTCYVPQQYDLLPFLTTRETLYIAARLKLNVNQSEQAIRLVVNDITKSLGLSSCLNTLANKLSGGEQKRLSIGVEMITKPSVLLLDEPTSGLDSVTSNQVYMLHDMTRRNCTVICAIHQPSSQMMSHFDNIMVLNRGRCMYCGPKSEILNTYSIAGFTCPSFYNVAEYVLEVITEQRSGDLENLYEICRDEYEKFKLCSKRNKHVSILLAILKLYLFPKGVLNPSKKDGLQNPYVLMGFVNHLFWKSLVPLLGKDKALIWPTRLKLISKNYHGDCFEGNACRQLLKEAHKLKDPAIYEKMGYLKLIPYFNAFTIMNKVVDCCFTSGKVGRELDIYLDELNKALDALNAIEGVSVTLKIHVLKAHVKECLQFIDHNNGLGYWSEQIRLSKSKYVIVLINILSASCFLFISYYMTGQPMEYERILKIWGICLLITILGQTSGIFAGVVFGTELGMFLIPICSIPLLLFSGFFLKLNEMPTYLQSISFSSFFSIKFYCRFAFEGIMQAIYLDRPKLLCSEAYCHLRSSNKILSLMGMPTMSFYLILIILGSWILCLHVIVYATLLWKIYYTKK
ncbi:ATP-binding cassette sub-family G member 1 [Trachymyrmex cornetzi]|uniref:ATP-binding cassette sub-family G member 1 n=1 Tax=Trachymyrmex cornetzi TaxID=471704 RepID=A0A151JQE1_9HYME|nr:ATP-binding cassette sub-family G member 1 [Trachymyrmex cornetzi]